MKAVSRNRYLDGGLGCLLVLRLDMLYNLRPWLKERRTAGHLLWVGGGGGGGGL